MVGTPLGGGPRAHRPSWNFAAVGDHWIYEDPDGLWTVPGPHEVQPAQYPDRAGQSSQQETGTRTPVRTIAPGTTRPRMR